eukprot:1076409-Pyramimonas_sp.AAC.1
MVQDATVLLARRASLCGAPALHAVGQLLAFAPRRLWISSLATPAADISSRRRGRSCPRALVLRNHLPLHLGWQHPRN